MAYDNNIKNVRKQVKELGFTIVEFYDVDGAQAYRFMNKDDVVIACRGTEPTQWNDIKADLRATPVKSETKGKVHKGFKKEVDDLWPLIKNDLLRIKKERIAWFIGHSLGAAMATIMASRCENDPEMPTVHELYTYGSPRVGYRAFVDELAVTHHRWVNNNDIVTRVPPAFMGYRHDGIEHYLNSFGNIRKMTYWQRIKDRWRGMITGLKNGTIDNFSDHNMSNYIKYIEAYTKGIEYPQR
jgi:triacylglycerol lipase